MPSARRLSIVATLCVSAIVPACNQSRSAPAAPPRMKIASAKPQDLRKAEIHKVIAFDPEFLESSAIGETKAVDGSVTGTQREFKRGAPVYLTMRFRESPEGLETTVRMLDGSKKLIYGDMHAMHGAKSVTFAIPAGVVQPGHYKVQGLWGGNLACEYPIEVK